MKGNGVWRAARFASLAAFLIASLAAGAGEPAEATQPDFSQAALYDLPAAGVPAELGAVSAYRIDAGKSRFMVKTGSSGLLSAFAHDHNIAIADFTGAAQITEGAIEPASLHLTIQANSLRVADRVSDSDRQSIEATMRNEVLETGSYPEIVFRSTAINVSPTGEGQYRAKIFGDLSLHGVTRSGLIYADVTIDGNALRARGNFPLRLSDYQMKPPTVAGGTIKVKNEIKLTFDIQAIRE